MAVDLRAKNPMLLMVYAAIFCVLTVSTKQTLGQTAAPIFIFGDSTMDVGTNNHIPNCTARSDHPYYGIDFPGSKSTGRFSNGLNTADTIGRLKVTCFKS